MKTGVLIYGIEPDGTTPSETEKAGSFKDQRLIQILTELLRQQI